jgi:hypothetical protein
MTKKKNTGTKEPIEGVENLLSRTEHYIEENQKSLTIIVAAIVIVVLGYLGYRNLYVAPLEAEARSQIHTWPKDILNRIRLISPFTEMGIILDL